MMQRRTLALTLTLGALLTLHVVARAQDTTELQQIGPWLVGCQDDRINDDRTCYAGQGELLVTSNRRGVPMVLVPAQTQRVPGSYSYLRIDQERAFQTSKGFWWPSEARQIIERMHQAQRVLIRYTPWPSRSSVDQDVSLDKFPEAWAWALRNALTSAGK